MKWNENRKNKKEEKSFTTWEVAEWDGWIITDSEAKRKLKWKMSQLITQESEIKHIPLNKKSTGRYSIGDRELDNTGSENVQKESALRR